jgi:hypothetical protein
MVCIVDRTWDSPCFVNLIRSTEICSLCSDVLILILSWPFLLKSQVLYADEFCRLLGWGLWCRSRIGELGFDLGLGARHVRLPLCWCIALSLTLSPFFWWQVMVHFGHLLYVCISTCCKPQLNLKTKLQRFWEKEALYNTFVIPPIETMVFSSI